MKKILSVLVAALLLMGCATPAEREASCRQITVDEAVAVMEKEGITSFWMFEPLQNTTRSIFPARSISPTKPSAQNRSWSCRIGIC